MEDGVHNCEAPTSEPDYFLPTLTIGGELDGAVRITRIAEAFYTQRNQPQNPVVVVSGMAHASVLDAAQAASFPKRMTDVDLKPEITVDSASRQVADFIRCFVLFMETGKPNSALASAIVSASTYFRPFVDAFVGQESNWFWTGGDEEHGSSPWAAAVQKDMCAPYPSNFKGWGVETNEFRLVSDENTIPPYFRPQHRAQIDNVTIDSNTISQLRFVEVTIEETAAGLNGFGIIKEEKNAILHAIPDVGENFTSAIEIATKLRSRQYFFNVTSSDGSPESLDDGNRCGDINQRALDWAYSRLPAAARTRYDRSSARKLVVAVDVLPSPPAGPFWIWLYMAYSPSADGMAVEMSSPYAFYSMDAGDYGYGNHYCKLLSPARALEFMLIDALRSA